MIAGGNAIRGSRIGAGPIGESERGEAAPRVEVTYWCSNGHKNTPTFSADSSGNVEIPLEWDCQRCGLPAGRDRDNPPTPPRVEPYKTHLAYVLERRSAKDGEKLLADALKNLRAKRQGK